MAQTITRSISIDVAQENRLQPIVAKQYDRASRFLNVQFLDMGTEMTIEQGATIVINAKRSDGQGLSFSGSVNSDGTVRVPITYWMLELDGPVVCDISIITGSSADTMLTSTSFTLEVQAAAVTNADVEENEDYPVLLELIHEVSEFEPELRDIRNGVHGQTFNSAGDAVRANANQLYDMKTGFDGVTYPSPVAMVQGEDEKLNGKFNSHVFPVTGQEDEIVFESSGGITTNIYLESGNTYTIKNVTSDGGTMTGGTLFIEGHNDVTATFPEQRGGTVSFTPVYSGYLRMYTGIAGKAGIRVEGTIDQISQDMTDGFEIIHDYLKFSEIQNVQVGKYMIGTTIDQTVSLSGTNNNWVYTPTGTFVNAGKTVRCRTRANGMCCIAVASTNDITSAVVKVAANDDSKVKEYTYITTSDVYVFISGRVNETVGFIDENNEKPEVYVVASGGSFTSMLKSLANNENEKIIYVNEGEYDIYEELGGDDYIATITDPSNTNWRDVNAIVPPNTTIIGRGNVTLKFAPTAQQIGSHAMAFLFSPLNVSGNCHIENITVYGKNCRYAIHDESSGLSVYADTVHTYKNVRARKEHGSYGGTQCFGSGVGARSRWEFDSCEFTSDMTNIWTAHTATSVENDSSSIIFNNCVFVKDNTENVSGAMQLIVGDSGHKAKQNFVKINNCYVGGSLEIITASAVTQKFDVTSLMSNVKGGFSISENFTSNPYPIKQYSLS